jgi:hypothetical protein
MKSFFWRSVSIDTVFEFLAGLMDTAPCKAMFLLSYDVCEVAGVVVVVVVAMLESTTESK